MMNWEQQRDLHLAKREQAMADARAVMMQSAVKFDRTSLPFDDGRYTSLQLELFAANPIDFDFIERKLESLPRQRQREHFRKLYLKAYRSVKDDGSIAFAFGNKQRRHANDYLRDVLDVRLQKVFSQYNVNVDFLQAFINKSQWLLSVKDEIQQAAQFSTVPTREELAKHYNELHYSGFRFQVFDIQQKQKQLPFYLITESKLKKMAYQISTAFTQFQFDCTHFLKNGIEHDNEDDIQGYLLSKCTPHNAEWLNTLQLLVARCVPMPPVISLIKVFRNGNSNNARITITCAR